MIYQDLKIYTTCLAVVVAIFAIDISLPLGVAGGVPYVAVIPITLWARKQSPSIYLAVFCSIMVVLGYYFSPAGGEEWKVFLNRMLAIFVIWVTAVLVFMWKAHSKEIIDINNRVAQEKEEIYFATIHGSQHIINNLLNQLQYFRGIIEDHPEFDKDDEKILDEILEEGSLLMNKLSSVENISEESIKSSVHPDNINRTDEAGEAK